MSSFAAISGLKHDFLIVLITILSVFKTNDYRISH